MSRSKQFGGLILIVVVLATLLAALLTMESRHDRKKFALFNAARDGDLEKVKLLIQQGSPLNLQVASSFGWTPLIGAIYQNKTNVAHYLIGSGADVNLADKNGETPLMWAATVGDEDAPLARDLIAHGARLDAMDKDGFTVFDAAHAKPPRPGMIRVLEEAKQQQKKK